MFLRGMFMDASLSYRSETSPKRETTCLIKIMNKKSLKITVGVPSATEYIHRKFMESFMNLQYPAGVQVQYAMVYGVQLPFARNHIIEDALKNNSDYLLWIDADMIFTSDLLVKLLLHNKDIINALAFRRVQPHYPCIFKWNTNSQCYETMKYSKGLLEVDAMGMSACLIKIDVFKKLKKPWYYYRNNIFSSDLTFCWNAKKAGYKLWVDSSLKIGHLGSEKIITEQYYLNHLSIGAKKSGIKS